MPSTAARSSTSRSSSCTSATSGAAPTGAEPQAFGMGACAPGYARTWVGAHRHRLRAAELADEAHDVLDAGVVLEAVHGQVLAVAGVLEAAVRHLGHDRDVSVDPHRAEVQPLGHPHRAAVVPGPHAGGQAVLDAVGPADRLVLVGEPLDGDDRAEDLVLDHLVVLPQPGHHGGLDEEAAVALPPAPGGDLGVVRRPVEEAGDVCELVGVVD